MPAHAVIGATCGAALRPGWDYRPALDEIADLGFNAVRVFAGRLTWCGQEPQHALNRLPEFLDESHQRGMNVHVAALTDTNAGGHAAYDRRQHFQEVAARCTPFDILERANEPWHPSQYELTPQFLSTLLAPANVVVADGASEDDEDFHDYTSGDWITRHLDRGRDKWNQVRRVRELMAVSEATGKPVLNGEPIGAGEVSQPGKREADPAFYYTLGALNRLFLGGSGIFHSQDGLMAQRLGPNQRRCAEAYIEGVRAWPGAHRLNYRNVGHVGSPVVSADFNEGQYEQGCCRSYSGLEGGSALNVTLGLVGPLDQAITWGNGWHPVRTIGSMPGVVVTEAEQG